MRTAGRPGHYVLVALCDFCGDAHARWRYTAASETFGWNACDTCHILVGNGWWLDLASRSRKVRQDETGRRRFEDFILDTNRTFVALDDASLATGGTWRGKTVPVGWQLDEAQERWLPPPEAGDT